MKVPNRILPFRLRARRLRKAELPYTLSIQPWGHDPFSAFFSLPTGSVVRRMLACPDQYTFMVTRVFTRLSLMVDKEYEQEQKSYEADVVLHDKPFEASCVLPLNYRVAVMQTLGVDVQIVGSPSHIPFFMPTIWFERAPDTGTLSEPVLVEEDEEPEP